MRVPPVLAIAFLAVVSFACTDSNSSPEPTVSPTVLGEVASPSTPTPTPTLSCPTPTPCPDCPEPIPCPEERPCPVCPEPVICPSCICPTCPDCPICPPPTVCPECQVCPPVTFCLPPVEPAGPTAAQQAEWCRNARSHGMMLESSISTCELLRKPCTYQREDLAEVENYLNAYCR